MDVIDTSVMPGDDIDPDALDTAAGQIRSSGKSVNGSATATHTAWQKLSGVYEAPEQAELYHAMNPVKTEGETFAYDLDLGASALETFAETVRTIKAAVVKIRAAAAAFEAKISDDGTIEAQTMVAHVGMVPVRKQWNEDHGMVDDQKQIAGDMSAQWEALRTAEITCANSLNHITGAPQIPSSGPGAPPPAPKIAEAQWYLNAPVDRKENCGEQIAHAVVIDFAGGIVSGVLGFVGVSWSPTTGKFGNWWDTFSSSWSGLNKLVTALDPVMIGLDHLPDPDPGAAERAQTRAAFFGGQVSLDPYANDPQHRYKEAPYRAWTNSVLNVGSWLLPPLKVVMAGKLAKAGEVAGDAAKASDLAKAGEATRFASAADLAKALRESGAARLGSVSDVVKTRVGNIFGRSSEVTHSLEDLRAPKLSDYDITTHHGHGDPEVPRVRHGSPDTSVAQPVDHAGTDHHSARTSSHGGPSTDHQAPATQPELATKVRGADHAVSPATADDYAAAVTKRAELAVEHKADLHARDALARDLGVDRKGLTVDKLDDTFRKLRREQPELRAEINDLEEQTLKEKASLNKLVRASEDLGVDAGKDYLESTGHEVVVGGEHGRGRPHELDIIGLGENAKTHRPVITVVEAKGASSKLGFRVVDGVRVQQGTTKYLRDLLHTDKKFRAWLEADPQLARDLAEGKVDVDYKLVRARASGTVGVSSFAIDRAGLHLTDLDRVVSPGR